MFLLVSQSGFCRWRLSCWMYKKHLKWKKLEHAKCDSIRASIRKSPLVIATASPSHWFSAPSSWFSTPCLPSLLYLPQQSPLLSLSKSVSASHIRWDGCFPLALQFRALWKLGRSFVITIGLAKGAGGSGLHRAGSAPLMSQSWLPLLFQSPVCGSLSAVEEQDSWLPPNWCERSHWGARLAGRREHQKKKREKKTAGVWAQFQVHSPLFFPVFHELAQLHQSKVLRATVESDGVFFICFICCSFCGLVTHRLAPLSRMPAAFSIGHLGGTLWRTNTWQCGEAVCSFLHWEWNSPGKSREWLLWKWCILRLPPWDPSRELFLNYSTSVDLDLCGPPACSSHQVGSWAGWKRELFFL